MNRLKKSSKWIEDAIKSLIENSTENTLKNQENDQAFERPLIGFSRRDDPLYEAFKEHVGPFCMTPWEIFAIAFREFSVKPEELTVISWVLPHNKATKADNRKEQYYPSTRWARGRIFGEEGNEKLRKYLQSFLESEDYKAIVPTLAPQFSIRISP